jgi:Zn-dependent M28 family amino/carboxypeptidase
MNHDTTLASRLRSHVETLCSFDPPRCWGSPGLGECGTWVRETLAAAAGAAHPQEYEVTMGGEPELVSNVVARLGDGPKTLRVIGAHYDAVAGTPGADDNASAVAVLLELARLLAKAPRLDAPVELVAYTLEEPPTFATEQMGSAIHALRLRRAGTRVEGMISLEMVGYFDATTGSQDYPAAVRPFLPSAPATGTFYALTAKEYARRWLTTVDSGLRSRLKTPLLALAVPDVYGGIDLSDHVPYQELGIPAAMLGDTSRYRNPHYHEPTDLPDTLDYERMADLTTALAGWLSDDAA